MKKWIWRILAVVFVGIFIVFLLSGKKDEETLNLVEVVKGTICEKALAVGTIEPEQEIKVKSTIPGIVSEVMFKIGDSVQKGSPLFKISPNPTPVEYVDTSRNMEMAQISLDKLRADRERNLQLFKESLISSSDMEASESAYNEGSLRFKITQDKFVLMEKGRIQLSNRSIDSTVKSPTNGMILSQNVF